MPRRRWHMSRRLPLSPELEHYLVTGCYIWRLGSAGSSLKVYQLAGAVISGYCDELQEIWQEYRAEVKQRHPGETYAESILRWDAEEWATPSERLNAQPDCRCDEHEHI